MSCFTTEYVLSTVNALAVDSCQDGRYIWVVQRFAEHKFSMHRWHIDTLNWDTVDFKNREVIEYDNGLAENVSDFLISSSNGKLYMLRKHLTCSRIFEFDTTTYEWRFMVIEMCQPSQSELLVMNNDIYYNSGNHTICSFTFGATEEAKLHKFPNGTNGQPDILSLCGMDGGMFVIRIFQDGSRSVIKYDRETETFFHVGKDYDEPRKYLEHAGLGEEYHTSSYSYNNKIYQRIQSKKRLMLDCFDIQTEKYCTIFDIENTGDDFVSISGTDKHAYMVYRRNEVIAVRVIDLKPTLETLSLLMVADRTVRESSDIDYVRSGLPYELRTLFTNMTTWKMEEWNKLKSNNNDVSH